MIQVIYRAIDVLEYLAKDPERPKQLNEIASHLNLNKGTCANIIKSLLNREFIEKREKQLGYILGPKIFALIGNDHYKKDLRAASINELERITAIYNENTLVAVLQNDARLIIASASSTHTVQAVTSPQKRAYDSASGRLLIALLPEPEKNNFIEKYGLPDSQEWEGVHEESLLRKELEKIKGVGYATQSTAKGIVGLAVPIVQGTKTIASLSIYLPDYRYNKSDKKELLNTLSASAKIISERL